MIETHGLPKSTKELIAASVSKAGVRYIDAGVSGGIWRLEKGYCMMMGGGKDVFKYLEPIYQTLAPEDAFAHTILVS